MSEDKKCDYLYVVKWDESVHRPPYTVIHGITLLPEIKGEDFEKFMREEAFPCVGKVLTRAGSVNQQYLLRDAGGLVPGRFVDLEMNLDSFGTRTSVYGFRLVGSWGISQSNRE